MKTPRIGHSFTNHLLHSGSGVATVAHMMLVVGTAANSVSEDDEPKIHSGRVESWRYGDSGPTLVPRFVQNVVFVTV